MKPGIREQIKYLVFSHIDYQNLRVIYCEVARCCELCTATVRPISKAFPSLAMQAAAPGWRQLLPTLKLPSRSNARLLKLAVPPLLI